MKLFLMVYLSGFLVVCLVELFLIKKQGVLTLEDLAMYLLLSMASWLGVLAIIIGLIGTNADKVIWERKEGE